MRRKDHTVVHVLNAGQFYVDVLASENGFEAVPRALLDTSLAGAFWGFTEHQNSVAAKFVARRMLSVMFGDKKFSARAPWIAAAAHALLAHRDLLPEYGANVLMLLKSAYAPAPDGSFLQALIGMAQLSLGTGDKEAVKKDVRNAIASLAGRQAMYGETIRWLDAKFSVLKDLAQRELKDASLEDELNAISDWLLRSYAGGQIAAYIGEAPLKGEGWHDALAQKKLR